MIASDNIYLGPLTQSIMEKASWVGNDDFPANQSWADDIESVLLFLKEHNQLERFLPRLLAKERDGALTEARTASYLFNKGFSLVSWEPPGGSNSLGEFEIKYNSQQPIFVEVKGPRWEGELDETERDIRKREGKEKNGEIRSMDSIGKIIEAINKAGKQNKFKTGKPNLLVIVTSNMFYSPTEQPGDIVIPSINKTINSFPMLSGVLLLYTVCIEKTIKYKTLYINNHNVDSTSVISKSVEQILRK